MTKKQQNRTHSFGNRSLSVILVLLMVLSTFAVVITATSVTANAAISYWQVAGDFNGWGDSLSDSSYRISGGSGSVTIDISSDTHSSIQFKMVAEEGGGKWCGISSSNDPAQISSGTENQLAWNSGNNIQVNLPSGTTKVTFEIIVKNGTNYVKVTPNGTGGGGGGGDTGQMTYSAPVNKSNSDNTADNLFWATATYFDYLSDEELSNTQWLKPVQAGTHNYGGAIDEWYPFYRFNRDVVKAQADAQLDWSEPMYFGNFCDTAGAYDSPHHQNGYDSDGYRDATNDYNVTRFVHAANNSDHSVKNPSSYVKDMYTSYQGLVNTQLSADGDLLLPNGQTAPYFNESALSGYAKVVNSSFPFKVENVSGKNYKRYTFNSKNATDNVYFTWDTSGGTTYPTGVNYGAGATYGVKDGISRFMMNGTSGYGIFPFNNASNNYKGTKTNANENLDYGFGIKTQVKFRVPKPDASLDINTETDPIYFDFTGDDDLWMYITDENGTSQLVLDMGGAHKESHGRVNFNTLTSTVYKVGASGTEVTKSFDFDYSKTYTMTIFYMERGLIESNCQMEFTMTPLGNNFIVTETIDTLGVNEGLQDVVRQLSSFGFNTIESGSQVSDAFYGDFTLSDGGRADIPDSVLPVNSKVKINQYAPSNSYLVYDTSWDYYDNVSSTLLDRGTGVTSNGVTTITEENTLINESGDEYDYAELEVDYRNTPQVTDVSVTKQVANDPNGDFSGKEFPATVYLQFRSDENPETYNLETSDGWAYGGRVMLKAGKTITIPRVPVGTRVTVVEDYDPEFTVSYGADIVAGSNDAMTVVNTPISPDAITGEVKGKKLLDDEPYTGNMFLFKLDGVAPMAGDSSDVIDTKDVHLYTNTVTNGEFTIGDLVFDRPGIYRYHVYEDLDSLSLLDAANLGATSYASDIFCVNPDYLVSFTVTKHGTALTAGDPVYIPYSRYEDMIGGTDADVTPVPHEMISDDFNKTPAESIVFSNSVQTGSVCIEKDDQAGNPLEGVTFAVYQLSESDMAALDGLSDEEQYDKVRNDFALIRTTSTVSTTLVDDEGNPYQTGYAQINDLLIYEDGYRDNTVNNPRYQQYVLLELSGPADYTINKTIHAFKFPMNGDDGLQYECTYKYINGALRSPSTSGAGMTLYKMLGWAIAGFSVLALGGYLLYAKKYAKRKTAKQIAE